MMRRVSIHPLSFVNHRQLVTLDLRHQLDFGFLHRDLVIVDLALALAGEITARSHRQSVGDESRNSGKNYCLVLIDDRRADNSGDQTEVCGEAIIESVHDVAQESTGSCLVPGLRALAGDLTERGSMIR